MLGQLEPKEAYIVLEAVILAQRGEESILSLNMAKYGIRGNVYFVLIRQPLV